MILMRDGWLCSRPTPSKAELLTDHRRPARVSCPTSPASLRSPTESLGASDQVACLHPEDCANGGQLVETEVDFASLDVCDRNRCEASSSAPH